MSQQTLVKSKYLLSPSYHVDASITWWFYILINNFMMTDDVRKTCGGKREVRERFKFPSSSAFVSLWIIRSQEQPRFLTADTPYG